MMKILCFVYLSSVILVSSNPLSQLVQSCNVCQPTTYSNPTSIPVVIQQPSNTNPYPHGSTVQVPAGYTGPLGETLNQIVLNKILSNPSLQKIIDPNTKLYNQNGNEVQRQVPSTVNTPNVINNYFIVPPEFFNLNETIGQTNEEDITPQADKTNRPRRRKLKRKIKKVEPISIEDEEEVVVIRKPGKRRKQNKSGNVKRKRKRKDDKNENDEYIEELDELPETIILKDQERERNKKKHRLRKKKKEQMTTPPLIDESVEDFQKLEDLRPVIESKRGKEIKKHGPIKPKLKSKDFDEESQEMIAEVTKPKAVKDKIISSDREKEPEKEMPRMSKSKKNQRKESSDKSPEDKILGNIEIPIDIPNKDPENRRTRDSKKNVTLNEPERKNTNAVKKQPLQNITPFPDEVVKNFFPHMPMGNLFNSNTNYPYSFDQYYQYLNPVQNSNANSRKNSKNQNRKNNDENSNTRTIEIKLKPRKKENTETPVITEKPEHLVSVEAEQSIESIEQVTVIPMEMPLKVSPTKNDAESSSKESYETFSKLEDLQDFITPELGTEEKIPSMSDNGIINDYYPIFDVDVYYNPYAEVVKNLDDDRYFYETGKEDETNRERRKLDRYEDTSGTKQDRNEKESQTYTKNKINGRVDPYINKYDHAEYLDHISTFSDFETPERVVVKSNADIRSVKVPSKNTIVKPECVETVSAGSKVAKYGVASAETIDKDSSYVHNFDESYSSDGNTAYVIAKSLGRPEDYW